jgi:hypothetical protein
MNGERLFQKHWGRIVSVYSFKEIMGCGMARLSHKSTNEDNTNKSTILTQQEQISGKSIDNYNREVTNNYLEIYKREVF